MRKKCRFCLGTTVYGGRCVECGYENKDDNGELAALLVIALFTIAGLLLLAQLFGFIKL